MMVMGADPNRGQRGMRTSLVISFPWSGWVPHGRAAGAPSDAAGAWTAAGTSAAGTVNGARDGVGDVVTAAASLARNPPSSWMVLISGAGNTTVVFLSTPISTRLCRLRSCNASGWAIMTSAATPSWSAASASPSAAMILARFSRSASAWRAIARCMLSGSWMSLSSTSVTTTPHASVCTSRISRMLTLMVSVSARVWSRVCWPTTLRRVVWAIWLIAAATFSTATTDVVAGDDALGLDGHGDDPDRQGQPQQGQHRQQHDQDGYQRGYCLFPSSLSLPTHPGVSGGRSRPELRPPLTQLGLAASPSPL